MTDISYIVTPFFAWLCAGCLKFAVNTVKAKRLAFADIGYGGFPSNHSAIVSSVVTIIGWKEGLQSPALVVAIGLAFIVMLDANSLRQQIGKQAKALNRILPDKHEQVRERMGHTKIEIFAGVATGAIAGSISYLFFV